MKLSFAIPSKSKPKTSQTLQHENDDAQESKPSIQYVTEFDSSSKVETRETTHIIPPKENEWQPHKRMKNLHLPISSDPNEDSEIRFEVANLSSADGGSDSISYGLNLRENTAGDKAVEELNRPRTDDVLLESFKRDIKRLPDEQELKDFEEVPVEGFAAALLGGYGWREGRGIGRNAKEDVKVRECKKWTGKEGLGFVSDDVKVGKEKPKILKEVRRDNGSGDGFFVGKEVRVVGGKSGNLGMKGEIVERLDRGHVVLRLDRMEGEVKVRVSDIAELGSKEEERCLRKLRELKVEKERSAERRERGDGDRKERAAERRERGGGERSAGEVMRGVGWLRRHIRVRIISKELKGGRLYLKKGEVVDVVGPCKCDITMDESRELVQGVDQEFLETALPRRGGPVLVLYGKHEGVFGNLLQRDLDREVGVVQDSDTHEMVNVKLEQIAEYVGDPSYIGY